MRAVPAAKQLVTELEDLGLPGKVEILPDIDGLGFHRQVKITKAMADAIGPLVIQALAQDPRIADMVRSPKQVRVVFVDDTRADHRHSFGLASVVGS